MMASDLSTPRVSPVDHTSPLPYYAQVKESLRESIERGDWKPGDQIPGEPELCTQFRVSRTVVRQALTELVYEGLIVRAKGKGTFVAEAKITENLAQKLTGLYEDMATLGLATQSQVLKQRLVAASTRIAGYLEVPPGTSVIEIERLRFVQDEPLVLVTTYVPYERCADLLQADLSRQSLYALMEKQCGIIISRGRRSFEAVAASQREAELLRIERGSPLMLLDSVSCTDDGTPIEYYHALHRGDRSRFEADLLRVRK
jgi:GntR family transcriptional regulator